MLPRLAQPLLHALTLILVAATPPVTLAQAQNPSLEVELRLPGTEEGRLEIDLIFDADEAPSSLVGVVPEWGGSVFTEGIIEDVRAFGEKKAERRVEVATPPASWRLEHAPGERLRLSYALPANDFIRGLDGTSYYKPIITEGLVHLIGQQALLLPAHWDGDQALDVKLRWRGVPLDQVAVSSFGLGTEEIRFTTTKEALRRGLFIAGEGSLVKGEGANPVHVFLASGPWRFEASELAEMAQRIVPAERDFFAEKDAGPFLISAIPVGPEDAQYLSYGGTGLEDAFATFIVPVLEMDEDGRGGLLYLLAHEKAHTWIGGRLSSGEEPETAGYWFSEGVTDYYTPRLLHRAGLMSPEGVVEEWNGYLKRYFLSPAAEATNQDIADGFWTDRDIQSLAYQRGAAVTFYLDQARRQRTKGEFRLDDLLLSWIGEARSEDRQIQLSNAELQSALAEGWTAGEIETAFKTLIDGRPLALPEDLLRPCAELVWVEEVPFELGFEIDNDTGKILSVAEGSAAHRIGLRADQQLLGWSIHYGDPTREIEVQRQADEGPESLSFLPAGSALRIPRFEIRDAAACSALM